MKKRVLSLLMALALCFTMLPTAALAQQTGAADVYTTGEDTAVQGKRAAEAVRAAQALIDALPDEVTADNAEEIAAQLANLNETLAALTEEQLAALDMARYEALCEQLAAQVSLTAERGGEHADHPICGDASCNKHGASLTDWVGVSELSDDMEEGYYYLTGPVTRTSTWYPKDGVVLCLNGYSISMDVKNSNNDSTICVNGGVTFTLCDCQNKGTVTHGMNGAARYTGSGVWVENGNGAGKANFVLYSGSISGNEYDNASIKFGAGVHLGANASFTMHGGSISGNKTAGYGGGVYVQAGTTSFTMTGGTITGNSAGHDGGGVYVKNGSFTMTGGTISGNTAGSGCNGGGVYADINANVTLSGAPVITENKDADGTVNNVYLDKDEVYGEGGTFIGEGGLSSTSSIGVTVDAGRLPTTDGGYTTIAEAAEGYTITADDAKRLSADAGTGYSVRQKDNTLVLVKGELPHEHPICGATHKDIGDHTGACADVTWTAWDGVSDITYDANNTAYVYLRDNADRDSALNIAEGHTLYLCLSGHSLTKNKTGKSVIKVGDNATLSLCDCSDAQSGKLTHGTTARGSKYEGHGVSLGYRSTFNMYGGSITGNRADTGGGVSLASEYSYAKFNMYGGSITNNAATNGDGGGGVHNLFGTFTMYGGSITRNSADTRCGGGGVYLARMGEFVMKGGEITGNTAKNGGGVYTAVNGNTGLTVSGDAAITGNSNTAGKDENVYLVSGKTIEIGTDGLGEKASIGVTTADTITTGSYVTVANGAENGYTDGNIFSDAGGAYCTLQEGDNVNLYNGQPHRHPICGEVCGHTGNEKHTDDIEWKPVSSLSDITEAGSYYLTKDVETSGTWEVTDGVNLCLNGHSIKCTNTAEYYPVISIKENITFTLTDCEGGETPHTFKKDDTGRWVQDASGEITVKGVIFRATDVRGSGVEVSGGTFNMYGGTVCGGRLGSGSGVGVYSGNTRAGTFNMYGGRISGNTATATSDGGGGGVFVCNSSTFNMSGNAAVSGNTAQYGGGVYLSSYSAFSMSDHAAISGNSAAATGGGVFVSSGSITMSSDAVISGNSAGNNGGGIYISYPGTFTMENGTISGNSADKNGGGVYVHNSGAFTMNSGSISGNSATQNGGGVYAENIGTAFTVKGGTIGGSTAADANAAKYGGGVYVKNGTFTMSGGKVTGNSASKDGGGVRLDKGTFNMSGSAVISRNTADTYGGGVDVNNGSFTMSGGSITGNTTTNESPDWSGGGGVFVFDDGSFTMSGGSITGNNAIRGGGVELTGSGTMTVSGSVQITNNWQKGTLNSASGVYEKGSSGKPENLYLYSGKTVAIGTDGLHADARIGVSTEDWPDPGSPVKIATNATNEESHYTAIFTPDAEEADYRITKENDSVYLSAHEHIWRYALKSGTKDTISATCEECSWNGGSVTIKAPEHTVYGDGKDQSVQIENTNWLPEYPANAVSYRKGEETIEAPTDAGSYTGVLTIGGVEATVDYTIGRKTVSAGDVTFSHTHTTYDGTQKNVADFLVVTVDGKTLTPGTDYVVFGTTSASDFEEEGYNARIALQGNYEGTVPFRWHIDPREVELEPVNAADRRYGDGKGNVTLRVTNAVGNDRVNVTVTGGDDLSVGTHSVTATALDRPEYTLPADAAKRTLTYSVGKGKVNQVNLTMYVYNNVAKTHTYDFSQALPALADGLTYGTCSYTGKTNLNANVVSGIGFNGSVLTFRTGRISSRPGTLILSYTATVKSDNYEDLKLLLYVQTKDKTVVDLPEADITMEGWSYGQTPNQPSVANLPAGAAPTFTYKDANGAEFTPAKTTDAGAYTVTVRYETEDTVHTGTRSFTVAPKTLTAEDIGEYGPSGIIPNKTYDGGTGIDLTGLGVKKAALVGTDENLIISGSAEFAGANAGDTTLVFTTDGELCEIPGVPGKASNYQIAAGLTKPFAARIDQRWLDFTVDSVSKRFGSPDSTADVRVTFTGVAGNNKSGLVSGETLVQGVDYDVTATFSQTAVGQDDGVVVTVTLKDTPAAKNYKLVSGSVATSGEIKKAAAPVISEQTVLVYSNAEKDYVVGLHVRWPSGTPAFSEYDTPLVEDTDLTEATAILRESFGGFKPSATAGDVAIDVHLKPFIAPVGTDLGIIKFVMKSANCEDAVVPVRFKVMAKTQRALSVSIENWTYGSTPSQPVYGAPGGTVSGPDITYTSRDGATSYGATAPTDAGDYTVMIRYESIDTIWSGSADFTISKKQITPPAADTTVFTYTADEQTYALAASPDYTVSDNTVQTNVGDYTVLVSLNDTANTEWADGTTEEKTYTFSIGPAALTVTALDKEILVGQSAPDLSDPAEGTDYRVEGLLGADVLTGVTLTYGETPDTGRMGSYAIHAAAAQANYDVACVSGTLTIRKAAAPVLADIPFSCKYTLTGEQTVDVSGLVPGAEGYTLGAAAGETGIVSGAAVDAGGVVTYTLTGAGKAGDSVTLPVTISSARYEDAAVNVVITLLPRDEQAALRVTGGTTVVYGETLQLGTSGGSGAGAVTYAVTDGTGKATIDANGVLTPVQVGAVTVTATKAGDDAYNDVTSAAVTININKARPTGEPNYKKVTGRGKTLRDAALTIEGGSLSLKDGTLEWLDENNNVLPDDTVIEAGKSYKWRFTPADGNYTAITSEPIKLYSPVDDDTGHSNSHNYRTIMVTVRGNGSVSPSGWAYVPIGGDQTFTITPDKGYAVAKVLIDGQSVGAVTSYTFRGITEGHTIEVIFMKANGNPQTGVDMGQRTVGCGR